MSGDRELILGRIRERLGGGGEREKAVERRTSERRRGPLPAWEGELVSRFRSKLEAAAGSLTRVAGGSELAAAVGAHLNAHGLPAELVLAPHPRLDGLPWPEDLSIQRRPVCDGDRVGLSVALAGIAETGSLVLASGPETPTALNFLVDDFLCLLPVSAIVAHLEDAWELARHGPQGLPRAINLITGPSRTADVEQTIQLGAHGPRRLHVLLWEAG